MLPRVTGHRDVSRTAQGPLNPWRRASWRTRRIWLPAIALAFAACLSAQTRPVRGITRHIRPRMVSESWYATLRLGRQPAHRVMFIGRYPGFAAAKKRANERMWRRLAARRLRAPRSPRKMTMLLPASAASPVFFGPDEATTQDLPPDSQLAVGPTQVVVVVNSLIAIYSKSGSQQGSNQSLAAFFGNLVTAGQVYDPRIIYDAADQRFILSAADVDFTGFNVGNVLLAVSQTSDATGQWNKYSIPSMGQAVGGSAVTFPDFPTLGLSSSAVYISTGQFAVSSTCIADNSCNFSDTWIQVVGLPGLLSGNATLTLTTFKNVQTAAGQPAFAIEPAVTEGAAPAEFLAAADFANSPNAGATLDLFSITTSGTPTLQAAALTVPSFFMPPDAPQPGPFDAVPAIPTNDYRLLNAVWSNGSLWCGLNTAGSSRLPVARWYQIALSSLSTASLTQSGDVSGSGAAYYPAIAVDASGDMELAFTTSSTATYASAAFTGRAVGDPAGATRSYGVYEPGTSPYQETQVPMRWGDYSGMTLDPSDGSFWAIAELAGFPDPNYETAIAHLTGPPELAIAPGTLDFGSVMVGSAGAAQTITVTNVSADSVAIAQATAAGPNGADFPLSADACSNTTLAAGQSCTVSVAFKPTISGSEWATLEFPYQGQGGMVTAGLSGEGLIEPILSFSPTSLAFPSTVEQTSSGPLAVTLTNTGNATAQQLQAGGSGYAFVFSSNCGATLAPGASCQVTATFYPTSAGSSSGFIFANAASTDAAATVTGTGVTAPAALFCPNPVTFAAQAANTSSPPQSVILTNTGSASLAISGIATSGDFSQTSNCGASLAPRASCTINVVFSPTASGAATGTLSLADNAAGSPQVLQLSGTGATAAAAIAPAAIGPSAIATAVAASRPRYAATGSGPSPAWSAAAIAHSLGPRAHVAWRANRPLPLARKRDAPRAARLSPAPIGARTAGHAQFASARSGRPASPGVAKRQLAARAAPRWPVFFTPNRGQFAAGIRFVAQLPSYRLAISARQMTLELFRPPPPRPIQQSPLPAAQARPPAPALIAVRLAGANPAAVFTGAAPLAARENFFLGRDPSRWRRNVPAYRRILARRVYPGINLAYYARHRQLEYDFDLAPGANPARIRLLLHRLGPPHSYLRPRIALDGDLVLDAGAATVRLLRPVVYQLSAAGHRRIIAGRYVIHRSGQVGFALGPYDHSRRLVIDPVLAFSTYLGGSGSSFGGDYAHAIATDASGNIYVAGKTASADFPVTSGAYQTSCGGCQPDIVTEAAYAAKLSPKGTLLYATYVGGEEAFTSARTIAVDASGDAYVAGYTTAADFPTTSGALLTTVPAGSGTGQFGFLTKLNSTGSALVYSTLLGGATPAGTGGTNQVNGVAVDAAGDAYAVGETSSASFPTTQGALQPSFPAQASNASGFLAKLNATGSGLIFSTYLGGSFTGALSAVALDSAGDAYVAGWSYALDFPTTPGALQRGAYGPYSSGGVEQGVVAKFSPAGSLIYSTYLGTPFGDAIPAIAADPSGAAYVTGSDNGGFPVTIASSQASGIFVAKLHPAGCALLASRYVAPASGSSNAIALDSAGDIYVAGSEPSESVGSYAVSPLQPDLSRFGGQTGLLVELDPSEQNTLFFTPFGGSSGSISAGDSVQAIALDPSGNVDIVGDTTSLDLPVANAVQPLPGGITSATASYALPSTTFVAQIGPGSPPPVTLTRTSLTFPPVPIGSQGTLPVELVGVQNNQPVALDIASAAISGNGFATPAAIPADSAPACGATLAPGAGCAYFIQFDPSSYGSITGALTITDDGPGSPRTIALNGTGAADFRLTGGVDTTVAPSASATFPVTAQWAPDAPYTGPGAITLACQGEAPLTCNFSPATVNLSTTVDIAASTLTLGNLSALAGKTAEFAVTGTASGETASAAFAITVQDFSLAVAPSSANVTPGQSGTFGITLQSATGFEGDVVFACTGAPAESTCSIAPSPLNMNGSGPTKATVSVTTTAPSLFAPTPTPAPPDVPLGSWLAALALLLLAAALAAAARPLWRSTSRAPRRPAIGAAIFLLAATVALCASCGGGGNGGGGGGGGTTHNAGTPTGNYTLTITASSGALTHKATVTLNVQ